MEPSDAPDAKRPRLEGPSDAALAKLREAAQSAIDSVTSSMTKGRSLRETKCGHLKCSLDMLDQIRKELYI